MLTWLSAINQWLAKQAPALKYLVALVATGGAIGCAVAGQWPSAAGFIAVAGGAVTSSATIKTNNLTGGIGVTPNATAQVGQPINVKP